MSDVSSRSTESFEDPLEDYSEPSFTDPVEAALHNAVVSDVPTKPWVCVGRDTSVREAMTLMAGRQIACVLVEENNQLVGVFGDRDVLDKVALEYDSVIDGPVSAVMNTNPVSVLETDSVAKVLSIMAVSGYRHVPVVTVDGKPTGIISPHRFGKFLSPHLQSAS